MPQIMFLLCWYCWLHREISNPAHLILPYIAMNNQYHSMVIWNVLRHDLKHSKISYRHYLSSGMWYINACRKLHWVGTQLNSNQIVHIFQTFPSQRSLELGTINQRLNLTWKESIAPEAWVIIRSVYLSALQEQIDPQAWSRMPDSREGFRCKLGAYEAHL